MTVSTATSFNSYAGNGSTTSFAYAFKIFQDSNLVVTLVNDTTGVETTQTLTTDYTVIGAGSDSGGSVVFGTAPASGNTVVIRRVLPVTQETNYVPNDPFPAETHEDALDKLTMLVQQEAANSELAISFPEGDVGSGLNNITPSTIGRASRFLGFTSNGAVTVSSNTIGEIENAVAQIDNIISVDAASDSEYVTYLSNYSGSSSRSTEAKLDDIVSVMDFGAVGDGVTDDTTAIHTALSAAKSVYFPSNKTFLFSNLALQQDGNQLISDGATMLSNASGIAVQVYGRSDVRISGLKWQLKNNPGIFITNDSSNVVVEKCHFEPISGQSASQIIYLGDCTDVLISDNYFTGCGYQVIQQTGSNPSRVTVTANRFIDNLNDAVLQNNDFSSGIVTGWICTNNVIDQTNNGLSFTQTECRGIGFTAIIGGIIANNVMIGIKGDSATHLENVNDVIIDGNVYKDNLRDVYLSGTATRRVLYITPTDPANPPSGTLTASSGGTCTIIWWDSSTNRAYVSAFSGTVAEGDTFTSTGGSGTIDEIDAGKVSARVSNNLFYRSTESTNYGPCVALNPNNDDSTHLVVSDNTFNSDDNTSRTVAISVPYCYKGLITGNNFKGFYRAIEGGAGNIPFLDFKISNNQFRRNQWNIYNQGQTANLTLTDNQFWDGKTEIVVSTSATYGLTTDNIIANNVFRAGDIILNAQAGLFARNVFRDNKIDSSVNKTFSSNIFDIFLPEDGYTLKRVSAVTGSIAIGGTWADGNTSTETLTGFGASTTGDQYANIYQVIVSPTSLSDLSGVVVNAHPNGTSGQVVASFQNNSGSSKSIGASGYLNYVVYQIQLDTI